MHTIIEPFRIKMTEALPITTHILRSRTIEAPWASDDPSDKKLICGLDRLAMIKAARRERRSGRKNDGEAP